MIEQHQGKLTQLIETLGICTSICFGGKDLKTLYRATGSERLDLMDHDGAVSCIDCEVAGVAIAPARVRPPEIKV